MLRSRWRLAFCHREGAMMPSLVVEAYIGAQVGFRIGDAVIGLERHFLVLERLPQALDKDVVSPGPPPASE